MDGSWVLPLLTEGYKRREEIAGFWRNITTRLLGRRSQIAITGLSGAGKTVFFDHLSGAAFRQSYQPPGRSQQKEAGKAVATGKRIALTVVPGQDSTPRLSTLDELFGGKAPVDGVIHVVCNGFLTLREDLAREAIREAGITTLQAFRDYQLSEELRDLRETLATMRGAIHKHRKPSWMLVAVAKTDLYYDFVTQARGYYSPAGNSPFVNTMREFSTQVGADNFRWDSLPVAAWLEDYEWADERVSHRLTTAQRDHYVAQFAAELEKYCAK